MASKTIIKLALTVALGALGTAAMATNSSSSSSSSTTFKGGIATYQGVTFEELRFYTPSLTATPTYVGTSISGGDLSFKTATVGTVIASGTDTSASWLSTAVVKQDLSPQYGGLGVITSSILGSSNDDAIDKGETLTLTFSKAVSIVGLHLFDDNHGSFDTRSTFKLIVDGKAQSLDLVNYPWFGTANALTGTTFTFVGGNVSYYLGAVKVAVVPEPATYALMGLGLVGIAAVTRRRRQA